MAGRSPAALQQNMNPAGNFVQQFLPARDQSFALAKIFSLRRKRSGPDRACFSDNMISNLLTAGAASGYLGVSAAKPAFR